MQRPNYRRSVFTRYNYLGSRSVDVTLRMNDEKPFKGVWKASIDGRAAFASDPVEFIRMLPRHAIRHLALRNRLGNES